jgi:hypothetical protein
MIRCAVDEFAVGVESFQLGFFELKFNGDDLGWRCWFFNDGHGVSP